MEVLTIRVDTETLKKLKALAKQEQMSVSCLIRQFIKKEINERK